MKVNSKAQTQREKKSGPILVPVDFSPTSAKAIAQATDLANDASKVILLHVLSAEGDRDSFGAMEQMRQRLERFGRREGRPTIASLVRIGTPFQEIVNCAKENNVGLIVLAVHGLQPSGGLGLGHTVDRVSRYAHCPVLLVRENETLPARGSPAAAQLRLSARSQ